MESNRLAWTLLILLSAAVLKLPAQQSDADHGLRAEISAKAERGDAQSQYELGRAFFFGILGVAKDEAEAVKWYRKAADQGEPEAQFHLGTCYANGQGVAKDSHQALKWYRMAAEQGKAEAQCLLGICYAQTLLGRTHVLLEGVPQDYAQAVKWFRRAANQGDAAAQIALGGCYLEGRGVPMNWIEAYRWLNLVASQNPESVPNRGVEAAAEARDALARKMTRDEVAEGQRLSAAFVPRKESLATAKGRDIFDSAVGDIDRPKATGSGFFITEDGYLITNEHVAGNLAQVRLFTAAGLIPARVMKVDAANDLALLKAEGKFVALLIAASGAVKLGGTVATVGFPNIGLQGFAPKLAKGEIAALSGASDDPRYFQISVPVQPGNSGGSLVDERGNVAGVVSAKLSARTALATSGALPENVNYAVKSSFLLSFLESVPEVSARLKEPTSLQTAIPKFEDVVRSAEQAAVLVLVY